MTEQIKPNRVTAERAVTPYGEEIVLRLNELPDGKGIYQVDGLGTIEISVQKVSIGYRSCQQIVLGIEQCPDLQGKRQRLIRTVDVGNGYGAEMIAPNRMLIIDTGDHKPKGSGRMRPEWKNNRSLAGPYGRSRWVWVKAD